MQSQMGRAPQQNNANPNKLKDGYILVLSMMIIALCVALLTTIVQQALNFHRQATFAVDREKARTLALGSIQLAISQISQIVEEKKEEATPAASKNQAKTPTNGSASTEKSDQNKGEKQSPEQKWLSKLLKIINKEQTIQLTEQSDGIDALIKIYIASENGKINLNELVKQIQEGAKKEESKKTPAEDQSQENKQEQKEKSPKKEEAKPSTVINELIQKNNDANIINAIKETQKRIERSIDDPTELLKSQAIGKLKQNIFIHLPLEKEKTNIIHLMDLFTISPSSGKLNPWLFSRSLAKIMGLTIKENKIEDLIKKFKPSMNWTSDWDKTLASTYSKKFNALPKITSMFGAQFEASAFSVVSYVKVGSAIQQLYAILEKDTVPQGLSSKSMIFRIAKIYWL